jgi:hypothetical protein
MNEAEAAVLDNLNQAKVATKRAVDHLNSQIAYLESLREMMLTLINSVAPLMERLESGKSGFSPDPVKSIQDITAATAPLRETRIDSIPRETYPLEFVRVPPTSEPMWKIIERTMAGRDKFTARQAGEAVERELRRSLGSNRPQTIRNNLIRKTDVFRQNEDSTWTVISAEKEAPIKETS